MAKAQKLAHVVAMEAVVDTRTVGLHRTMDVKQHKRAFDRGAVAGRDDSTVVTVALHVPYGRLCEKGKSRRLWLEVCGVELD